MSQVTLLAMAKDTLPQPEMSVHDGVDSPSDDRNDEDDMQVVEEVLG